MTRLTSRFLVDLLLRRTRIGLLLPEGGMGHLLRIRTVCQAELGWEPRVQLDAGLEKTIHYFKQFLQS